MEASDNIKRLYDRVRGYTMIGLETADSMHRSAEIVVSENIPGALVECGTWKGGSLMAGMLSLMELGDSSREVWGYDNFAGMPQPGRVDGTSANGLFKTEKDWCLASQADLESALRLTGYPTERVRVVAGPVEETIPAAAPESIAILRLDTDWYSSTKHELVHLYPRLARGGVLIIDDYGAWPGCRQAVHEYFEYNLPQMTDINWTARMMRKP